MVSMYTSATTKSADRSRHGRTRFEAGALFTRKIWLPKLIYGAVPYFYILVGALALAATIYIHEWFWVVPHYLLFAAACLHMGFVIYRRRHRAGDDT